MEKGFRDENAGEGEDDDKDYQCDEEQELGYDTYQWTEDG